MSLYPAFSFYLGLIDVLRGRCRVEWIDILRTEGKLRVGYGWYPKRRDFGRPISPAPSLPPHRRTAFLPIGALAPPRFRFSPTAFFSLAPRENGGFNIAGLFSGPHKWGGVSAKPSPRRWRGRKKAASPATARQLVHIGGRCFGATGGLDAPRRPLM